MPKVLITGDWQLDSRPPCDRRDKRGKSIRFEENVQTLLDMVANAKAQGCTQMVFLGDLTEELNPDSKTLDAAATVFRAAMDAGMTIDAVAGNHDGSIYEISSSSLEPLGRMAPDKFVVHHEVGCSGGTGIPTFVYLPYLHQATPEQIRADLVKIIDPLEGDLYLFGHYGAQQSKMGAKNLILPGDYLDADSMLADQFNAIWMGHIHKAQTFTIGTTTFRHPGSPYICDFGEREDPKGYCIFSTEAGIDVWYEIKPKRNWVVVDYNKLEAEAKLPWAADDIVKFVGTYELGNNPREAVRLKFKNGDWPQPFFVTDDFKRLREDRDVRAGVEAVAGAGGFAEAVAAFVAQRWPGHARTAEVIKAVTAELQESKLASVERFVVPTRVVATDFMSHRLWDQTFFAGQTTLIVGPNGLGKTNMFEAVLFALTGETSKGLKNPMLVRQGTKKASVLLFLQGETNLFFISRTLTLTKTGATHKVEAGTTPIAGAAADWYTDKKKYTSLADGGVQDTQAAISAIVGATFKSLRATNFVFQDDPATVIKSDPMDRKAILGEILGFEPMAKAFKTLDGRRLASQRSLADRKAELDGLKSALDPVKEDETRKTLAEVDSGLPGLKKAVEAKTVAAAATAAAATECRQALEAINAEIQAMPNSAGLLTGARDTMAALEKSFNDERERRVRTYTADKKQVADLKAAVVAIDVNALTARAEVLTASKASHQKTIADAEPEIKRLSDVDVVNTTEIMALDKEWVGFNKEIEALKTNDIGKCSKCGGDVDSAHIEKEISDLEARVAANRETRKQKNDAIVDAAKAALPFLDAKRIAERDLKAAGAELETIIASVAAVKVKLEELGRLEIRLKDTEEQGLKAKNEFETKKTEAENKISGLESVVKQESRAVSQKVDRKAEVQKASDGCQLAAVQSATALSDARVALATAEKSSESLTAALAGFAATRQKLAEKEKAIADAVLEAELRAMASEVLDPKAGLPVWLIDARIPELEDSINRYMEAFVAEGLTIRLSTVKEDGKETLDILVDNGEEPILDVAAYSGGQLQRIEVCIKLALADLAEAMRDTRLGLLCFDEPGYFLDDERKTKLIEVIHERCSSGRTPVAIVISHDRKLMSGFQRRLAITKTEEATELVQI